MDEEVNEIERNLIWESLVNDVNREKIFMLNHQMMTRFMDKNSFHSQFLNFSRIYIRFVKRMNNVLGLGNRIINQFLSHTKKHREKFHSKSMKSIT